MRTVVSSKGQVVLPAELRRKDHIEAGQTFEVRRISKGKYELVLVAPRRNQGLIKALLACPVKLEGELERVPSESTDTIFGNVLDRR